MSELVFIKLGGSLITDKQVEASYRSETVLAIGETVRAVIAERPELRLLLGHGSGSFGHVAAARHGTRAGIASVEQWQGFAEVASAAAELNRLVRDDLRACQLPVMGIQPSASVFCEDGDLVAFAWPTLRELLARRLIPLIYGDVALDTRRGGTIASTEEQFAYLAQPLAPSRILLLGEVAGVYDATGQVIPRITPADFAARAEQLSGSAGTDVTGGMLSKVRLMLALVARQPSLRVRIMSGEDQQALRAAILEECADLPGTLIVAS